MNVLNMLVSLNSVILIFLVVNVFKPFFGSYAAKKGENLATKEDIAQLTKIAEEIRAEISDKVWDRQKQWEMRRDAIFEVVRALGTLDNALLELNVAHSAPLPDTEELRSDALQNCFDKMTNWNAHGAEFDEARFLAGVLIGEELDSALGKYIIEMRHIVVGIRNKTKKHDDASQKVLWQKLEAVRIAVRKELKIDNAG
jgi:hypothetical protein